MGSMQSFNLIDLVLFVGATRTLQIENFSCEMQYIRIICSGLSFSTIVDLKKSTIARPKVSRSGWHTGFVCNVPTIAANKSL